MRSVWKLLKYMLFSEGKGRCSCDV